MGAITTYVDSLSLISYNTLSTLEYPSNFGGNSEPSRQEEYMEEFLKLKGRRVRVDFPGEVSSIYNQLFKDVAQIGNNTMLLIGVTWYNLAHIQSINEQN